MKWFVIFSADCMWCGMLWRKWIPTVRLWYEMYIYGLEKIGKNEERAEIANWDAGQRSPTSTCGWNAENPESGEVGALPDAPAYNYVSTSLSVLFKLLWNSWLCSLCFVFFKWRSLEAFQNTAILLTSQEARASVSTVMEIGHISQTLRKDSFMRRHSHFCDDVLLLSQIKPLAASPALFHPQLCIGHQGSLCLYMLFLVISAPWPKWAAIIHPLKVHYTQTLEFMQSSWTSGLFFP